MRDLVNKIVKNVVTSVLNEGEFKMGDSIVIPGNVATGRKIIRAKYGLNPDDFEYVGSGKFVYKVKPKKTRPKTKAPKYRSQDLGRKEGETEQEYLERVREINPKFAEEETEIPGEEWRPIENKGRYFKGAADFSRDFEVSNMGRVRIIDYQDPMRSIITSGYDAPYRNARQITIRIPGMRTTPPLHTLVADAWLPEPPGGIENYFVEHIDGNYQNNRADNLRYVPRKGMFARKAAKKAAMMNNAEAEAPLAESVRRMIKESVRRTLNEWADGTDTILAYHITTVGGDKLTHNEISVDEAIRMLANGNLESDTEPEPVPRSEITFGTNATGQYFLTYDKFTGAFDVWARCQ